MGIVDSFHCMKSRMRFNRIEECNELVFEQGDGLILKVDAFNWDHFLMTVYHSLCKQKSCRYHGIIIRLCYTLNVSVT